MDVNRDDRQKFGEFREKLDVLTEKQMKLDAKVDRVLDVLQDDSNSTSRGLISEVNELHDQVLKLIYVNTAIKRVFWFLTTIVASVLTFLIKNFFEKN